MEVKLLTVAGGVADEDVVVTGVSDVFAAVVVTVVVVGCVVVGELSTKRRL